MIVVSLVVRKPFPSKPGLGASTWNDAPRAAAVPHCCQRRDERLWKYGRMAEPWRNLGDRRVDHRLLQGYPPKNKHTTHAGKPKAAEREIGLATYILQVLFWCQEGVDGHEMTRTGCHNFSKLVMWNTWSGHNMICLLEEEQLHDFSPSSSIGFEVF